MNRLVLMVFFCCSVYGSDGEVIQLDDNRNYNTITRDELKEDVMKWVIEELSKKHVELEKENQTEKKKRIFASIVALVAAISTIVSPIIAYYYSCD